MATGSAEATLFQIWYYARLMPQMIELIAGEAGQKVILLADERTVLDVLRTPEDWFDTRDGQEARRQRDQLLEQTLVGASWDVWLLSGLGLFGETAWGDLLTVRLKHLADARLPDATKKLFALPDKPRGGDLTTPGMAAFDETFSALYGASWRMVVDVGAWDNAVFVNAPGQSGDPRSPHFQQTVSRVGRQQSGTPIFTPPARWMPIQTHA